MKKNLFDIKYWLSFLVMVMAMPSCIEEYVADVDSTDIDLLVVDGAIVANSVCEFTLSRSIDLNDPSYEARNHMETEATLSVESADGSTVFHGYPTKDPGVYVVPVGELNSDVAYRLRIEVGGEVYVSDAMQPIDAPAIERMSVAQEREDHEVELRISTEANTTGGTQYLSWDYDETWEVNTPYSCAYYYDPQKDDFLRTPQDWSKGWKTGRNHAILIASTSDFVGQRLEGYPLYVISWNSDRIQTLYRVNVTQSAISLAEYEYQSQRKNQSTEMGGLFTPMPSELPSNIHCTTGDSRAIGFVGVRGKVSRYTYYVTKFQVTYQETRRQVILNDSFVDSTEKSQLYAMGYQIVTYESTPAGIKVTWGSPWLRDARAWGATLERPENWPNVLDIAQP